MRRNLIVGSIMVVLLFLGIWLGYSGKQPTKQVQVQLAKKAVKPASKPKPVTTTQAQQQVPTPITTIPPALPAPAPVPAPVLVSSPQSVVPAAPTPAPLPVSKPPSPPRSVHILSGNSLSINILSGGGGWAPGVAVNGYGWGGSTTRWIPGYIRRVCEDRSTGRVCYDTWEPAHYE